MKTVSLIPAGTVYCSVNAYICKVWIDKSQVLSNLKAPKMRPRIMFWVIKKLEEWPDFSGYGFYNRLMVGLILGVLRHCHKTTKNSQM